jgi:hypothetical protein
MLFVLGPALDGFMLERVSKTILWADAPSECREKHGPVGRGDQSRQYLKQALDNQDGLTSKKYIDL